MSDTCYKSQSKNLIKKRNSFAKVVKYCLEKNKFILTLVFTMIYTIKN